MRKNTRCMTAALLAAAMALLLLSCGSCGSRELPAGVAGKLNKVLKAVMDENGIPGAVAGAWVPDRGTWIVTVGTSNVKSGTVQKAEYRFRIGSITKTFTATVILQLADEKKLGLDDSLDKYVPGFKYGDRITVRQLCNNSSGVFAYDDTPGFTEENIADPQRRWSPDELVGLARAGEPYFEPGTDWRYCNSNFVLLGVIAEKVTGRDLENEIEERILEPLGLDDTLFPGGSGLGGAHSHGYVKWAGRWGKPDVDALDDVTYWNPSWGWAAGAMISTLEDLHTWAKALATGELLSKEMQKERLTWIDIPGGEVIGAKYGLGIYAMGELVGHDGMLWGYNSAMYYYPPEDATLVVLFNKAMDQKDGQWVSPDLPFIAAASSVLFPGKMPWDQGK